MLCRIHHHKTSRLASNQQYPQHNWIKEHCKQSFYCTDFQLLFKHDQLTQARFIVALFVTSYSNTSGCKFCWQILFVRLEVLTDVSLKIQIFCDPMRCDTVIGRVAYDVLKDLDPKKKLGKSRSTFLISHLTHNKPTKHISLIRQQSW